MCSDPVDYPIEQADTSVVTGDKDLSFYGDMSDLTLNDTSLYVHDQSYLYCEDPSFTFAQQCDIDQLVLQTSTSEQIYSNTSFTTSESLTSPAKPNTTLNIEASVFVPKFS